MPVKIILSKGDEPVEKREFVFDADTISIGREPSTALPLAGSLVSKHHARIERRESEYVIVDLNSTNATYVNGDRLVPGKEHSLHQGDRVSISDYNLEIIPLSGRAGKTVMTMESAQPPEADTGSEYVERWEKLTAAIQESLQAFNILDLARRHSELEKRYEALVQENRKLEARLNGVPENKEQSQRAEPAVSVTAGKTDEGRAEEIAGTLLQLFFKLASGRSSFLSEFVVRTVVRPSTGVPGQFRSETEALRYFTDARLTGAEFSDRLNHLRKESDQIVLHMMGLLEGYRRSVDEGAHRLLQRVDPDRLEEDLPDSAFKAGSLRLPLRYFPALLDLKIFRLVRNRLRDLIQEDRGVLEKQMFRPGFIRAYEECVESSRTESQKP